MPGILKKYLKEKNFIKRGGKFIIHTPTPVSGKIVFNGGSGRFAMVFKKIKHKYKIEYLSKKQLNIESFYSVLKYLEKT